MHLAAYWSDMPQIPPFKFYGELAYIWEHARSGVYTNIALAQHKVDRYEVCTHVTALFFTQTTSLMLMYATTCRA